jgi:hypothetical protein
VGHYLSGTERGHGGPEQVEAFTVFQRGELGGGAVDENPLGVSHHPREHGFVGVHQDAAIVAEGDGTSGEDFQLPLHDVSPYSRFD